MSYWELQAGKQVHAGCATSLTQTHTHTYTDTDTHTHTKVGYTIDIAHNTTCNPCSMYVQHTLAACKWLQRLFMFSLPNVTQLHPPSARSQTSYQEFSGCLPGSDCRSKLMAQPQPSLQRETYPPIYHTDGRRDVAAGECAATQTFSISITLLSSPFDPSVFCLFSHPTHLFIFFFTLFFPPTLLNSHSLHDNKNPTHKHTNTFNLKDNVPLTCNLIAFICTRHH